MTFDEQLDRIMKAFPTTSDEHLQIIDSKWRSLNPDLFNRMVNYSIEHVKANALKTAHMAEAFREVSKTHRGEHENEFCIECDHIGFKRIYYTCNGFPYQGLEPCRCNPVRVRSREGATPIERVSAEEYRRLMDEAAQESLRRRKKRIVVVPDPDGVNALLRNTVSQKREGTRDGKPAARR